MSTAPVSIVADAASADRWIDEREAEGYRRREDVPLEPWDLEDRRWVTVARLDEEREVGPIVLGVLRGVATVIVHEATESNRGARELLEDDLARIAGPISPAAPGTPVPGPGVELDAETLELLTLIAGGASMAEAASAVRVSLRTAERRLTSARKTLGVRTTAEAVARVVV